MGRLLCIRQVLGARTVNRREAICVIESMLDGSTVLTVQAVNAMVLSLEALNILRRFRVEDAASSKTKTHMGMGCAPNIKRR